MADKCAFTPRGQTNISLPTAHPTPRDLAMTRRILTAVCLLWALASPSFAAAGEGEGKGKGKGGGGPVTTIHRDVAIVGGGAAGSYSAVRLREDFGVSVVVIEKDTKLVGGSCPAPPFDNLNRC